MCVQTKMFYVWIASVRERTDGSDLGVKFLPQDMFWRVCWDGTVRCGVVGYGGSAQETCKTWEKVLRTGIFQGGYFCRKQQQKTIATSRLVSRFFSHFVFHSLQQNPHLWHKMLTCLIYLGWIKFYLVFVNITNSANAVFLQVWKTGTIFSIHVTCI